MNDNILIQVGPNKYVEANRLIELLRSLHADIEAMRNPLTPNWFGEFIVWDRVPNDESVIIEWPNLAILSDQIKDVLG